MYAANICIETTHKITKNVTRYFEVMIWDNYWTGQCEELSVFSEIAFLAPSTLQWSVSLEDVPESCCHLITQKLKFFHWAKAWRLNLLWVYSRWKLLTLDDTEKIGKNVREWERERERHSEWNNWEMQSVTRR